MVKESGWNEKARNKSSGRVRDPAGAASQQDGRYGADYLTNPVPQIRWGLNYIKSRYSSPCGAWNFWQANHWY